MAAIELLHDPDASLADKALEIYENIGIPHLESMRVFNPSYPTPFDGNYCVDRIGQNPIGKGASSEVWQVAVKLNERAAVHHTMATLDPAYVQKTQFWDPQAIRRGPEKGINLAKAIASGLWIPQDKRLEDVVLKAAAFSKNRGVHPDSGLESFEIYQGLLQYTLTQYIDMVSRELSKETCRGEKKLALIKDYLKVVDLVIERVKQRQVPVYSPDGSIQHFDGYFDGDLKMDNILVKPNKNSQGKTILGAKDVRLIDHQNWVMTPERVNNLSDEQRAFLVAAPREINYLYSSNYRIVAAQAGDRKNAGRLDEFEDVLGLMKMLRKEMFRIYTQGNYQDWDGTPQHAMNLNKSFTEGTSFQLSWLPEFDNFNELLRKSEEQVRLEKYTIDKFQADYRKIKEDVLRKLAA